MRGPNVYLSLWDISMKMLSIAVTDPLKLLAGNLTVLVRLYVASKTSNCCRLQKFLSK